MGWPAGHLGPVGHLIMGRVDPSVVAAWVRATCAAQGMPEKITDPVALRDIGVLLGARAERSRAHGAPAPSTRPTAPPSLPPVGHDPLVVQPVPPGVGGGQDRDGVQDGFDDGDLPGEIEGLPDFL